ncbi:uncharacterized protein LOC129230124 [Uloborus diversus]|uniref:uncharacterized protein LOC129230124 n=1 Tax=Uloborus diversus TaxID=327109 RepID=UPI0024091762|nr:uncharacterized protein LOC129230124 [Uloborus diversus]
MKKDKSYQEDLKDAVRLCWICHFSNRQQLVQVLDTCFMSDVFAMFCFGNLYAAEAHENSMIFSGVLSDFLEYIINACVEQKSRLYMLMAKGIDMNDTSNWMAAHLLLFHALHRGTFQDLLFLLRHGIVFHGFYKPDKNSLIVITIPHNESLATLRLLFDLRKGCELDIRKVVTTVFEAVPYPTVPAQCLKTNDVSQDFIDMIYTPLFPDWAAGPSVPRTLKHLARCAVRDRLRDCFELPQGIYSLPIEQKLKDYLDLSFSENASFFCGCGDCRC